MIISYLGNWLYYVLFVTFSDRDQLCLSAKNSVDDDTANYHLASTIVTLIQFVVGYYV